VAHRKRRQDLLEKAESDRKAKRLKQSQAQRPTNDRDVRDERGVKRDAPRNEKNDKDRTLARKEPERDRSSTETQLATVEPKAAAEPPPPSTSTTVAVPAPPNDAAKELARFVKDHPHFMRVLENPKKSLADPRVKNMFVAELSSYPVVKAFLVKKGLNLS